MTAESQLRDLTRQLQGLAECAARCPRRAGFVGLRHPQIRRVLDEINALIGREAPTAEAK